MGPSSYKTYLSFFYNSSETDLIYLNQKTTIEELLGGPIFISNYAAKNFYFTLLCDITHQKIDKEIKEKILDKNNKEHKIELKNFETQINEKKENNIQISEIIDNIFNNMIKIIYNKTKEKQIIVFNPGSILLKLLKKESLIFKNIHQISTEVFERFNELFGTEGIISLNEDIYGTFFPDTKQDKIIDLKKINNISIIATCPENSTQSLSESILSRFSIICVGEHEDEEKEKIIKKFSKKYFIPEKYLNNIISKFKYGQIKDIKKIQNLIVVFSEMNKNNLNSENNDEQLEKNFNYTFSHIQLNPEKEGKINSLFFNNKNILYYNENNIQYFVLFLGIFR